MSDARDNEILNLNDDFVLLPLHLDFGPGWFVLDRPAVLGVSPN